MICADTGLNNGILSSKESIEELRELARSAGAVVVGSLIQKVKKIINETFASHRSLKMVTVVDDDIDPTDSSAVEYAMATRFQADKDLVIIKNVRGSSLDPSSDQKKLRTAKMVLC